MKDLTKIYIDLSKCTEEERKSLPKILEKAGDTMGENIIFEKDDFSYWTNFHKPHYATYWTCGTSNSTPEKTELTYPEFIKLFEGGDYPGKKYQPLFDHLNQEHGLILHASEMDEIIRIVHELNSK